MSEAKAVFGLMVLAGLLFLLLGYVTQDVCLREYKNPLTGEQVRQEDFKFNIEEEIRKTDCGKMVIVDTVILLPLALALLYLFIKALPFT